MTRGLVATAAAAILTGCATLTNHATQPVHFAAPGCETSEAICLAYNKRGSWLLDPPETIFVRRSDDPLSVVCEQPGGETYRNATPSRIGRKFVASVILLDLGLTDAITDRHREYPAMIELELCATP